MIKRNVILVFVVFMLLGTPALTLGIGTTPVPGQSSALSVKINPPKLPADGGVYPSVIISLADKAGLPTITLSNTTVFLSSSQSNVGTLPSSVIIPPGNV